MSVKKAIGWRSIAKLIERCRDRETSFIALPPSEGDQPEETALLKKEAVSLRKAVERLERELITESLKRNNHRLSAVRCLPGARRRKNDAVEKASELFHLTAGRERPSVERTGGH